MNLYKLERPDNFGYDEFDSAIVAAHSKDEARLIHPREGYVWEKGSWIHKITKYSDLSWISPEKIIVTKIGETKLKAGVIIASFNAG